MFFLIPCLDNEMMESSWNPAQVLEGVSPSLWLRADQGVYTGGARQFYSPDKGQLAIADNAALSVTTQDFTIGIWAYLDSTSVSWIVSKGGGGAAGYSIYAASGAVYAEIKTAAGSNILITGPAISTSAWHFITAEFDRDGNGTIYVDNVAGTPISISANSGSIDEAGAFSLGAYYLNTFNFAGRLSRAFKLDRLLTTAERTWLYNSGNGRIYGELGVAATDGSALLTSLSAYWNLNETSGTANAIDQHSTNDLTPTFAEIVTNGSFASDTGWTKEANWTISAGVAHSDGTQAGNAQIYQAQVYDSHRYSATFTVSGYSAGTVGAYLGGALGTPRSANGTYVETITSGSTDFTSLLGDPDFVGDIDNFSVVAVDIPAADGPSSDIASDSIGTNHGTLVNFASSATSWSSDRPTPIAALVDGSLEFDGTNDYVLLTSAIVAGSTFSLSMWVKPNTQVDSFSQLFSTAAGAKGLYYRGSSAGADAGKLDYFESGSNLSTGTLTNGAWNHVVISVASGSLTYYINGSSSGTASGITGESFRQIGDNPASQTFLGSLSDFRYYNTALSLANVQSLYAGTNYTTGLIARYKLDDGPQTGLVDGDPVVRWTSIEGGYHDFEQATASKRPLYRSSAINSQPGIDFDGVDDLLVKASAFLTGTAGTVVIVYRLDAVPNTYQVLLCSADEALATKRLALLGRGNTANPHLGIDWQNAGTADLLDGSTTVNVDTDYGGLFQSNGTTATAKLNGTAQTLNADTGANSGNWWDDATAKDNVSVGAQKDSAGESRFTTGKICEIYVHPANLTTGLTQLAAYILARYGVTL